VPGFRNSWREWHTPLPCPRSQVDYACSVSGETLRHLLHNDTPPVLVGEWSLALPTNVTPPYPLDADGTAYYRAFAAAQWEAYGAIGQVSSSVLGAIFWNFKSEAACQPPWDWELGVKEGFMYAQMAQLDTSLTRYHCAGGD
jgi:hypothetical protein